ncbi:MAG TPA: hypothetical protein VGG19_06025 [Tepidisphaeraceae bacterium]|jgi:hypothetical protein
MSKRTTKTKPARKAVQSLSADKNGKRVRVGDVIVEENGITGRVVAVDREGLLFRAFEGSPYCGGMTVGEDCSNCVVLDDHDKSHGTATDSLDEKGNPIHVGCIIYDAGLGGVHGRVLTVMGDGLIFQPLPYSGVNEEPNPKPTATNCRQVIVVDDGSEISPRRIAAV